MFLVTVTVCVMLYFTHLKQNNVICVTAQDLRERVAEYLEEYSDVYMPFVTFPIASENILNRDTETPNAVDTNIFSVADLHKLWGDHVVIAAITNMFHVTINVVHARQPGCTVSVTSPVDDEGDYEINIGLSCIIYHFVGLDKQVIPVVRV